MLNMYWSFVWFSFYREAKDYWRPSWCGGYIWWNCFLHMQGWRWPTSRHCVDERQVLRNVFRATINYIVELSSITSYDWVAGLCPLSSIENRIIIMGSTALSEPWPPQVMSPATSILGIHQRISTTQFPCIFLCPFNPSWFRGHVLVDLQVLSIISF